MARDHAPKERQRRQLERKLNQRGSYDRILIVSEGSRSEPNYFGEIRAAYQLHTANVLVRPSEAGTAPRQVVEYARDLFKNGDRHRRIQKRAFEQVFTVFDRDEHDSYSDALRLAASLDGKLKSDTGEPTRFQAIASVPSFELWLLLHYEDVRAPLHRDEVMRRLRRHLPGYTKGMSGSFDMTRGQLALATQRADALADQFTAFDAPEPFTGVGTLVRLLTTLKDR